MRVSTAFAAVLAASQVTSAISIPTSEDNAALTERSSLDIHAARREFIPLQAAEEEQDPDRRRALERRKGGGGGGGRSGGSGSSSSGSSGSGSSSSGSGSGSSGSGSGSSSSGGRTGGSTGSGSTGSGSTSSSSNTGGRTSSGSGTRPAYGGGGYYGGGATQPYKAGNRTPSGIGGFLLAGAALSFLPFLFLSSVYLYSYPHNYGYYNRTSNRNESRPVNCFCEQDQECGCDQSNSTDYVNSIIGNGSYADMLKNGVATAPNGTIYINGSLPNGTTAPGGTDDSSSSSTTPINAASPLLSPKTGYIVLAAAVGSAVFMM